ncbi:MAG TPA: aldehyde dehydrogenase family protein, partial [Nitrospiraceae bacterium]|nr:aldehyde dehydrogenase family protein [Nitrospiraceae bacterium]
MVKLLCNRLPLPIKTQHAAGSRIKPIGKIFGRENDLGGCVLCHKPKPAARIIRLANDIEYGLSSYVWTENLGRAHRVAAAIEAGMCFVNSQNVRDLRQPFGGTKASGTGREGGTWSYEVFLEPKNVAVSLGRHHIPHW